MDKKYFFCAGLSRSGSTLLSAILNQNPEVYCSEHSYSAAADILSINYNFITMGFSEEFQTMPNPERVRQVARYGFDGYHSDISKPIVICRHRHWLDEKYFIPLTQTVDPRPKFICTVRPLLEILASYINLVHKNPGKESFIDRLMREDNVDINDTNRCLFLMNSTVVGREYECLRKAYYSDLRADMHLVEYSKLVNTPDVEMNKIYDFLGIDRYEHDFKNIKSIANYKDAYYNLDGMHDIRPKISPSTVNPEDILPPMIINMFKDFDFWKVKNRIFSL